MQVIKRSGKREDVSFDKITARVKKLCYGLDAHYVEPIEIAKKVIQGLYDGVTTTELDNLAAETAATMATIHPDYAQLAARIAVSNLHKNTDKSFYKTMRDLLHYIDPKTGEKAPLVSEEFYKIVAKNKDRIDSAIIYDRDYAFDYFGFKTLERSYLMKTHGKVIERPQHLLMRVSIGLHGEDIDAAMETYNLMSEKWFIHATPTLFNAGTPKPQMSSCFLLSMTADSIEGIFETLARCAKISQSAGGIGLSIHNIRATGSYIKGTGGFSNGLVPMLKVFNDTARYVDQGGNRRKGAFAMYLEPWHADVFDFLELKKNHGKEEARARDLFYALWVPDLFMERVKEGGDWSLFCPNECPGLFDSYGGEFEALYHKYEREGKQRKTIKAQELWFAILESQIETGTPYILYKDAANKKSNQKNLGAIRSSNLCTEIIQYTSKDEVAVCFTKDTKILTKNGLKNIVDCDGEEVYTYFESDSNLIKNERFVKATLLPQGIKEVYQIQVQGSKSIKATLNHPFLVRTKRGMGKNKANRNSYEWKKLSEIEIGDYLFAPKNKAIHKVNIHQQLDNHYLTAGWMLGDGWQVEDKHKMATFGVCFGKNDEYAKETVVEQLISWHQSVPLAKNGWHNNAPKLYQDRNGVYAWSTSKIGFKDLMQDKFGFQLTKASGKRIYDKIANAQPHQIASFLSGLFSADGCVTVSNAKPCIALSSASETLLHDVQALLRVFGVHSRVRFGEVSKREGRFQGTLAVMGQENLIAFMTAVGFKLAPKKEAKFNEIFTNTSYDFTIEGRDYLEVQRIICLGEEEVFDLNVPEAHHFVADGVLVHNCNLGSLSLGKFVENNVFDHQKLYEMTRVLTRNLNKVIDINYYPVPQAQYSNFRHRPIGLGVQGLADAFILMRYPFESAEAKQLNKEIFETIYFAAMTESCALAEKLGAYETFKGSPVSQGIFQFDMWNVTPTKRWDWETLRAKVMEKGVRNSLLVAPMPTASTSQILGNNECFEPYTSNIYSRRTLSGEHIIVNKHLLKDLVRLGLWDQEMREILIAANGSVQHIEGLPDELKLLYKTAWEISQRAIIDMSADRGAYICQSQSLNVFIENPTFGKLTSMHFHAWQKGLKTGMYYMRSKSAVDPIKFSISQKHQRQFGTATPVAAAKVAQPVAVAEARPKFNVAAMAAADEFEGKACSMDDPDCAACSA